MIWSNTLPFSRLETGTVAGVAGPSQAYRGFGTLEENGMLLREGSDMMAGMSALSVIVPARNEEGSIGDCLESVAEAARRVDGDVTCIVVLNACTDGTERIARERGAVVTTCETRNLAAVRNSGARAASGDIVVTIDADSRMPANALFEVEKALTSGRYVGGGVPIVPERCSAGILVTGVILMVLCLALGVPSAGMFWCYRRDFEAIGGFDESRHSGEDIDFARRLKRHGRGQHKRFGTLWNVKLRTSCRKFDEFGDWFFVRLCLCHPVTCWRALRGRAPELAERYWYGVER